MLSVQLVINIKVKGELNYATINSKNNSPQKKNWKNKITIISVLVMLFILATNTFSQSNQPNTTELESQITNLTNQLQEANSQITTLKEQNKILTGEKNDLTQKLQEANNKIAILQNENTSLTATNNEQNQKIQNANSQITDLQNKNTQLLNNIVGGNDFYTLAERIRQEIATTGRGTLIIETTEGDPNTETTYTVDLSNAPASSTVANNYIIDTNSKIVYITDTGDKYHRDGCSYLRESKHEISRSNATAQGYTPCSRCKP